MVPEDLVSNILGDWREDGGLFVYAPYLASATAFAHRIAKSFGPAMTRSSDAVCCGVIHGGSFHIRFMGTMPPRNVWFEYPPDRPAQAKMTRMDFEEQREPFTATLILPTDPTTAIA